MKFLKVVFISTAVLLLLLCALEVEGLENGLARTPPMGWLSWERYECRIDCALFPNSCIDENLYKAMIDRISEDGWLKLGYEYVNVDDCWSEMVRDPKTSELIPDSIRFPSGIKALADYAHSKGVKLGIYGDVGDKTCGLYPGSYGYFQKDAETFAKWGIDSLKLDGCYCNKSEMKTLYPMMTEALNSTGRKILYSCSWPAYIQGSADYQLIAKYCNLARDYWDIHDSWDSIMDIMNWWAKMQDQLVPAQKPGYFNDPDMIIIGNYGLTEDQSKVQMSIWAIMAAPLYMSNDLRKMPTWAKEIMQNSEVIAIDQDPLGIQGTLVKTQYENMWWLKKLCDGSYALAVVNYDAFGAERRAVTVLSEIGIMNFNAVKVRELWEHKEIGIKMSSFASIINPTGCAMYKLTPVNAKCSANLKIAKDTDHVSLATCSGNDVQLWSFNNTDKTIRLKSNPTLCLKMGSDSVAETGTVSLELSTCSNPVENAQHFQYNSQTNAIVVSANANCLQVASTSVSEWTGVTEGGCSGDKSQKWTISSNTITDGISNRCLTVCSPVVI